MGNQECQARVEVVARVSPALELMGRATHTPTIVMEGTGTATLLVPATMTLGRGIPSTTVVLRAPRGQVECPTPLTPTRTRATPTPITSNHQPEPGLLQHQVQVICRSCCCQEACSAVLLHNSYFVN